MCLVNLFIFHLSQFVSDSMSQGLEVILTVDTNEHVVKGKLAKQLKNLGFFRSILHLI